MYAAAAAAAATAAAAAEVTVIALATTGVAVSVADAALVNLCITTAHTRAVDTREALSRAPVGPGSAGSVTDAALIERGGPAADAGAVGSDEARP